MSQILFSKMFSSKYLNYVSKRLKVNLTKTMTTTRTSTEENTLPILTNLKITLAKKMGRKTGYSPIPEDRSHLLKYLPKSQEELPKRSMQDSFIAGLIPLSTDKKLQDRYVSFLGHVRVGRLLEEMDMFAVMVAHKHIVNPNLPDGVSFPYTLVTALVDKIDFTDFIPKSNEDIKISGKVSWVGRSSLEVVVWLEQQMDGSWHRITRALFLIAARDPTNTNSAVVNAIEPADDKERKILSGGEARKQQRIKIQQKHVSKVIPDVEEQKLVYDLYLRTSTENNKIDLRHRRLPPGCIWMSDCTLSNVVFSHPEDRNIQNTVFGGFIMRQASELSWVLSYIFSKHRPVLKSISDINFQRPIAVNSLIRMHAHVVYTQKNFIQITTYVEVYDPITGKSDTTNILHFTFKAPELVNECIPLTYHETMMYIDGRRHFLEVMNKPPGIFQNKL